MSEQQGSMFDFYEHGGSQPADERAAAEAARPTIDAVLFEYKRALELAVAEAIKTERNQRVECPCCDVVTTVFARPFDGQMLDYATRLYRHSLEHGFGYHHARQFLGGAHKASSNGTELTEWHFIEGANGNYRITRAGAKFVRGEMRAPAGVIKLHKRRIGWFREMALADDVRGRPWDYTDGDNNLDLEGIPNWTSLRQGKWQ